LFFDRQNLTPECDIDSFTATSSCDEVADPWFTKQHGFVSFLLTRCHHRDISSMVFVVTNLKHLVKHLLQCTHFKLTWHNLTDETVLE